MGLGSTVKAYNSFAPFILNSEGKLIKNAKNSLTKNFHLLTIDFPCKTGFMVDPDIVSSLSCVYLEEVTIFRMGGGVEGGIFISII